VKDAVSISWSNLDGFAARVAPHTVMAALARAARWLILTLLQAQRSAA
jgi:hypothetical protein